MFKELMEQVIEARSKSIVPINVSFLFEQNNQVITISICNTPVAKDSESIYYRERVSIDKLSFANFLSAMVKKYNTFYVGHMRDA